MPPALCLPGSTVHCPAGMQVAGQPLAKACSPCRQVTQASAGTVGAGELRALCCCHVQCNQSDPPVLQFVCKLLGLQSSG